MHVETILTNTLTTERYLLSSRTEQALAYTENPKIPTKRWRFQQDVAEKYLDPVDQTLHLELHKRPDLRVGCFDLFEEK